MNVTAQVSKTGEIKITAMILPMHVPLIEGPHESVALLVDKTCHHHNEYRIVPNFFRAKTDLEAMAAIQAYANLLARLLRDLETKGLAQVTVV